MALAQQRARGPHLFFPFIVIAGGQRLATKLAVSETAYLSYFNNNIFFAYFYYKLYNPPRLALLHAGCIYIFLVICSI